MVGENPRKKLFQTLTSNKDQSVSDRFSKYTFDEFEKKLLSDKIAQDALFDQVATLGIVKDRKQFDNTYLGADVTQPAAQPAAQPVVQPAAQPAKKTEAVVAPSPKVTSTAVTPAGRLNTEKIDSPTKNQSFASKAIGAISTGIDFLSKPISVANQLIGGLVKAGSATDVTDYRPKAGQEKERPQRPLTNRSADVVSMGKQYAPASTFILEKEEALENAKENKRAYIQAQKNYYGHLGGMGTVAKIKEFDNAINRLQVEVNAVKKNHDLLKLKFDDRVQSWAEEEAQNAPDSDFFADGSGYLVPKEEALQSRVNEISRRMNVAPNQYVYQYMKDALKTQMAWAKMKPTFEKNFDEQFRALSGGKSLDAFMQAEATNQVAGLNIQSQAQSEFDLKQKEIIQAKTDEIKIESDALTQTLGGIYEKVKNDPAIKAAIDEYDKSIFDPLQLAVNNNEITAQKANEWLKSPELKKKRDAFIDETVAKSPLGVEATTAYNNYITKVSDFNTRALRRIKQEAALIDKKYKQKSQKSINQIVQKYKPSAQVLEWVKKANDVAYAKTVESGKINLRKTDINKNFWNQQIGSILNGLGRGIESTAFLFNLRNVGNFGANLASQNPVSDLMIEDWNQYSLNKEGITRLVNTIGVQGGQMIPTIAATTGVVLATRGIGSAGLLTRLLASSLPQWAGATMQIAGQTKQEVFAQTGSASAANEAARKAVEGQAYAFPAYLLTGLKYFKDAGKMLVPAGTFGIGNIARAATSVVRVGTQISADIVGETLEEMSENANQQAIVNGGDVGFSNIYKELTLEKFSRTMAQVSALSGTMSGVPAVYQEGKRTVNRMIADGFYAKNILGKISHPALLKENQVQWLSQMYDDKGEAFVGGMISTMLHRGDIDKKRAQVLAQKLENYKNFQSIKSVKEKKNPLDRQAAFILYDRYIEAKNSGSKAAEQTALENYNKYMVGQGAELVMVRMPDGDYQIYTYDDFNSLMDNKEFQQASSKNESKHGGVFEITPLVQTQDQLQDPKLQQIIQRFEAIKNSEVETETKKKDEAADAEAPAQVSEEEIEAGQQRTGFQAPTLTSVLPTEYAAVMDAVKSNEKGVTPDEVKETTRYVNDLLRIYNNMRTASTRNLTLDQIDNITQELSDALDDLSDYKDDLAYGDNETPAPDDKTPTVPGPSAEEVKAQNLEEQVAADVKAGRYSNITFDSEEDVPEDLRPYLERAVRFKQDGVAKIQITAPASLIAAQTEVSENVPVAEEEEVVVQEEPTEEPVVETETPQQPTMETEEPVTTTPTTTEPVVETTTAEEPTAEPAKPKAKINLFTDDDVIDSFSEKDLADYRKFRFEGKDDIANEMIRRQRQKLVGKEVQLVDVGQVSDLVRQSFASAGIDVELLSADEFIQKLKEAGESAERTQEGVFDDKRGKIFINKEALQYGWGTTVIWHEAIHPIMNIIHNSNKPLYDKIHRGIMAAAKTNKKFAEINDWVESRYKDYTENQRKDELIVETLARISAGVISFNEIQPNLRQRLIDLINRMGRIMGLTDSEQSDIKAIKDLARKITSTIKEGKDLSAIVGKENIGKFQRPEGLAASQMSIDGRLSEPGVEVPSKEKLPKKISPSAEEKTFQKIDDLLDRYPNALTDRNQWKELMSRVFPYKGPNGEVYIPAFPEGLARMAKSPKEILKELEIVSEEQRRLASEGIEKTKEIGELFERKEMDEVDTGLYFLWNIMSIGISPYPQEAGFLRAVDNGIHEFIEKAANGTFLTGENVTITDIDEDGELKEMVVDKAVLDYYDWVDSTLPKNTPGSGAKANLRAFGRSFLSKASEKITSGEFAGKTRLQALHEILSDRETPTNKLRRKWQANMSAMSFNNKIFDFILLTTGRSDLFVIDRVRTEHFWDAKNFKKKRGLAENTSIYDGKELKYGKSSAAGYSKMLSDVAGLVFAELANRTMQPLVKKAYEKLGVKDSPDVGRFHWETWVAASSQEVSHGSIDAIVQRKKAGEIQDAGIRQGKYGSWDFNFSYRKLAGEPFRFEFKDDSGNTYIFDDISEVQNEIDQQNNKKTYSNSNERFILKDEDGKIIKRKTKDIDKPWYEQEGVDKQKYFDFLRSKAKEVIPAPNVIEDQGVVIGMPEETGKNVKKLQPSLGGRGEFVNTPLGVGAKPKNVAAQNEDVITTKINVSPFYSVKIKTIEEANAVFATPAFKKFEKDVQDFAKAVGIKITNIEKAIGGFKFDDGSAVKEASTILDVTGDWQNIVDFTALIGALTPEVQESTIAGRFVDAEAQEHNADLYSYQIDNTEAALQAVADAGFDLDGFTLINGEIKFINAFYEENGEVRFLIEDIDKKINTFVGKYKEYGGSIQGKNKEPVQSEYIDYEKRADALGRIAADALRPESRWAGLRDRIIFAEKRNKAFQDWKEVKKSEEADEYADLRREQIEAGSRGDVLSDKKLERIKELEKFFETPLTTVVSTDEEKYLEAKAEIDAIANDVAKMVAGGFASPFKIKRPARAAIKVVRWYSLNPNMLGDGSRTNIIVNTNQDADYLFQQIRDRFTIPGDRVEYDMPTGLGYPKRLIEIRTSNGKIAEIQVMTPQGYLAKDGVKDFPDDKQDLAREALGEVQDRLGWKIPDGVGHYFYEIERDTNVQNELRKEAVRVSNLYYEAFLNPDSTLSDSEFRKAISDFKDMVDSADKSKWDETNKGEAPASLVEYLGGKPQASLGGRQAAPSFADLDKILDMPPAKSRAAREKLIDQYGKETVDRMIEISRNFTKIINGLEEQGVVEKDCP